MNNIKSSLESLPISRAVSKKSEYSRNDTKSGIPEEVPRYEKDELSLSDSNVNWLNENVLYFSEDRTTTTPTKNHQDQEVPSGNYSSRIASSISPISLLMDHNQKLRNSPPIIWKEFSSNGLFGCGLHWGSRFWVTPTEYTRKKGARIMAALMACIEIFGNRFIFEGIDLNKYESWTKESVRKMSDDQAAQKSIEIAQVDALNNGNLENPGNTENTGITGTIDESSSNQPYTALVNEKHLIILLLKAFKVFFIPNKYL